jgi:2-furoyl-CoA dehydrogenase large subunit
VELAIRPLLNEKNKTTIWKESCRIMIDVLGFVTVTIHTASAGQGHDSLAHDGGARSARDRSRSH